MHTQAGEYVGIVFRTSERWNWVTGLGLIVHTNVYDTNIHDYTISSDTTLLFCQGSFIYGRQSLITRDLANTGKPGRTLFEFDRPLLLGWTQRANCFGGEEV